MQRDLTAKREDMKPPLKQLVTNISLSHSVIHSYSCNNIMSEYIINIEG